MTVYPDIPILLAGYLLGALPSGLIVVRVLSGKDVRRHGSGRTGGTNAFRAAGLPAGILTALMDVLKGAASIWVARAVVPDRPWLAVLAGVLAVIGHNYSIFLMERETDPETGRTRLRIKGGAGGATTFGGSIGLWGWNAAIILPIGAAVLYGLGYASVATLTVGVSVTIIMTVLYLLGASPWQYIFFGVITLPVLVWALRPNIRRLFNGTERLVGWRARRRARAEADA